MKALFKQTFVVFLILISVGAVLACTIDLMPVMDNMASNNDGLISHLAYIKSLTSAVTSTTILVSMAVLFFTAIFAALSFYRNPDIALLPNVQNDFKWKRRDYSYIPLSKITYWLSLFESSPNSINPA
ncbi:MAG: hypothetical protein WC835_02100 [Candidatus Paceibacterota bacterium]